MIKQISAGIVLYHKDGEKVLYLLLQYLAGHWDFPKGKLEAGETKIQAAIRELEEETSLRDVLIKEGFEDHLVYTFKEFKGNKIEKTVHFFLGEISAIKPIMLSREHKNYQWLPFDQAVERLTYQNAKDVLIKAHDFLLKMNK